MRAHRMLDFSRPSARVPRRPSGQTTWVRPRRFGCNSHLASNGRLPRCKSKASQTAWRSARRQATSPARARRTHVRAYTRQLDSTRTTRPHASHRLTAPTVEAAARPTRYNQSSVAGGVRKGARNSSRSAEGSPNPALGAARGCSRKLPSFWESLANAASLRRLHPARSDWSCQYPASSRGALSSSGVCAPRCLKTARCSAAGCHTIRVTRGGGAEDRECS